MQDATISATMLNMLMAYMSGLGFDTDQLIQQAGLDPTCLHHSNQQPIATQTYCQIYQACMDALAEKGHSVFWAGGMATQFFKVLCNCIKSAETLWDVLERTEELCLLLDDRHDRIWFEVDSHSGYFNYQAVWRQQGAFYRPARYDNDVQFIARVLASCLVIWQRFCSWLIGRNIEITEVQMGCQQDPDYHKRLVKNFGCDRIVYDHSNSRLCFPKKFLDFRVVHTEKEIEEYMKNAPYHLIVDQTLKTDPVTTIKSLVGSKFNNGLPTFEEIAGLMNMSLSSLRRELVKENITYQDIKNECRRSKAVELLQDTDKNIGDISKELGFIEPASFTRSFKNWTGTSPLRFRMHYRKQVG